MWQYELKSLKTPPPLGAWGRGVAKFVIYYWSKHFPHVFKLIRWSSAPQIKWSYFSVDPIEVKTWTLIPGDPPPRGRVAKLTICAPLTGQFLTLDQLHAVSLFVLRCVSAFALFGAGLENNRCPCATQITFLFPEVILVPRDSRVSRLSGHLWKFQVRRDLEPKQTNRNISVIYGYFRFFYGPNLQGKW